jgi:tetratricopeptide (TPR) repeat protein
MRRFGLAAGRCCPFFALTAWRDKMGNVGGSRNVDRTNARILTDKDVKTMQAAEVYKAGEKLKAEGRHEEACEKFRECLKIDESYVLAHYALAVSCCLTGQYEDAVKHAQRACELEPQDPFSYMSLSVTYQRTFQGTQDPQYIQLAEDAMARSHTLRQGH